MWCMDPFLSSRCIVENYAANWLGLQRGAYSCHALLTGRPRAEAVPGAV